MCLKTLQEGVRTGRLDSSYELWPPVHALWRYGAMRVFEPGNLGRQAALGLVALVLGLPPAARSGGPKWVAGTSYFNPAAAGQPLHWAGGQVNYYVDQGPLNGAIGHQQATAMVDAAAALWSSVATAGVTLTDKGTLNEDVNGANIAAANGAITQPADATASATNYPVAVIFDADGTVIDAIFGVGASDPTSCQNNGVMVWGDNVNPDATIAHGAMVLNGRCATSAALVTMMSYELERAFGRLLGLDYAQVNPEALTNGEPGGMLGWPVMQPDSGLCGPAGGQCIPQPSVLRYDDIAALNRLYPIAANNLANFPGKQLTAANTISIQGTIAFQTGTGMQGVNVVARPLDPQGHPLYQYTVSAVSGALFGGNRGNAIAGFSDSSGQLLAKWGSNDATQQGFFDLSGMPLPPGTTTANYQVSFEAIDPMYIHSSAVGPYVDGSPAPSGTMPTISVPGMSTGSQQMLTVSIADSATGEPGTAIASESSPRMLPASGMWFGRLSQVGQTDWLEFPVRGSRQFTIVTQSLDETGAPSNVKAMPMLGVWDAFLPVGSPPVGAGAALNGWATGESWLAVTTSGDDIVRLAVADQRGDGRPDYAYQGWVLYADRVWPSRLPASGGPIVIHGMGFRQANTVQVGGQPALVTSFSPNEITAIAPPAPPGTTGSVDVEVDDLPAFYASAVIPGGISYDAGQGDALALVTAPANTVPIGVPMAFTVQALGPDLTPAGGVTVNYAITSGTATMGCGQAHCAVTASGDGFATIQVTATDATPAQVTASLTNGSSLQAQFTGGTPPALAALTPNLSVAAGATVNWVAQTLALDHGLPLGGQAVTWRTTSGIGIQGAATTSTNSTGIATQTLTVGPLVEGQQATASACLNGTSQCVAFSAWGARPEYASLKAVSGTTQSLATTGTPVQMVLRLLDMDGNPLAGGMVTLYQALYAWAPPCPPHGRCATSQLISSQASTAISTWDGTVTFLPATLPGVATNLLGQAVSGNTAIVNVAIETHP